MVAFQFGKLVLVSLVILMLEEGLKTGRVLSKIREEWGEAAMVAKNNMRKEFKRNLYERT
jgi:phosphoribosyl-ATP pyrophosphohydrolase